MILILSRKGFDSSFGGIPSRILPEGTLLIYQFKVKKELITINHLLMIFQ